MNHTTGNTTGGTGDTEIIQMLAQTASMIEKLGLTIDNLLHCVQNLDTRLRDLEDAHDVRQTSFDLRALI